MSKKIALALQGGGQKGIFTAGVLDYFIENKFDPFSLYYGSSAGALNLCAYLSRQIGYGKTLIEKETTTKEFFQLSRYLGEKKGMDLAWLIAHSTVNGQYPFNYERAHQVLKSRRAYACATNMKTLQPEYFPLYDENFEKVLQATSAIPLISEPVEIKDQYWIDGGVSATIPVFEPYAQGADIIVVIRTDKALSSLLTPKEQQEKIDRGWSKLLGYINNISFDEVTSNYPQLVTSTQLDLKLEQFRSDLLIKLDKLRLDWRAFRSDQIFLKLLEYSPDALKDRLHKRSSALDNNSDKLDMFLNYIKTGYEIDQFLMDPPESLQVITIAPEKELKTKMLNSPMSYLIRDYQQGQESARLFLEQYETQLKIVSETPNYI